MTDDDQGALGLVVAHALSISSAKPKASYILARLVVDMYFYTECSCYLQLHACYQSQVVYDALLVAHAMDVAHADRLSACCTRRLRHQSPAAFTEYRQDPRLATCFLEGIFTGQLATRVYQTAHAVAESFFFPPGDDYAAKSRDDSLCAVVYYGLGYSSQHRHAQTAVTLHATPCILVYTYSW